MLIGINVFGFSKFSANNGLGFQYWNEICPPDTPWIKINARTVGLSRCSPEPDAITGQEETTEEE